MIDDISVGGVYVLGSKKNIRNRVKETVKNIYTDHYGDKIVETVDENGDVNHYSPSMFRTYCIGEVKEC